MKKGFLFGIACFSLLGTWGQKNQYQLLQFSVPENWQMQSRAGFTSYRHTDQASQQQIELKFFLKQAAAPKADSCLKLEWRRLMDSSMGNPVMPTQIRRRYTPSGIAYAETGGEFGVAGKKQWLSLYTFLVDKEMQSMLMITDNAAAYKQQKEFMAGFLESIDTIKKRNQ